MKLMNDFFQIVNLDQNPNGYRAEILLNGSHAIYRGHFPGFPITPGVVQMKIVHELLEYALGKRLQLIAMPECKFLMILDPNVVTQIVVHLKLTQNDNLLNVKASGENATGTYFKLSSIYELVC